MAILQAITTEQKEIILPALIKLLVKNTNDSKYLTSEKIIHWFSKHQDKIGFKISFTKQTLMKLTNYIRMNNMLALHSSNKGYCVTSSPEKIQETIDEFQGRIESHIAMMNALKKTKADLELDIQVKAFDEAKLKREKYQAKVTPKLSNDLFDEVDNFKSFNDLFK